MTGAMLAAMEAAGRVESEQVKASTKADRGGGKFPKNRATTPKRPERTSNPITGPTRSFAQQNGSNALGMTLPNV